MCSVNEWPGCPEPTSIHHNSVFPLATTLSSPRLTFLIQPLYPQPSPREMSTNLEPSIARSQGASAMGVCNAWAECASSVALLSPGAASVPTAMCNYLLGSGENYQNPLWCLQSPNSLSILSFMHCPSVFWLVYGPKFLKPRSRLHSPFHLLYKIVLYYFIISQFCIFTYIVIA